MEMAEAIVKHVEGITEASVQVLSSIRKPVAEPHVVNVEAVVARKFDTYDEAAIKQIAHSCLERVDQVSQRLGTASAYAR